jgi:hypothetical protein
MTKHTDIYNITCIYEIIQGAGRRRELDEGREASRCGCRGRG